MDLVTYTYLIGFLNYHGLISAHLNEYTKNNVYQQEIINRKFSEIISGEQWNINRHL
tara:strand:+ start:582 stop:752 length:171 start_codon:yes stop_codon:yes gene_type:complete